MLKHSQFKLTLTYPQAKPGPMLCNVFSALEDSLEILDANVEDVNVKENTISDRDQVRWN